MSKIASSLLSYPFEKQHISWPESGQKTLIWGGQYFPEVNQFPNVDCIQSFKPYVDQWKSNNIQASPVLPKTGSYDLVLIVLSKQKEQSLFKIAYATKILKEDGLLIAAAENNSGGRRLEKWFEDFGFKTEADSKKKCRVVRTYNRDFDQSKIDAAIEAGSEKILNVEDLEIVTKPGVFGWNKIDKGSALLAENISEKLTGIGADFGCGYGFLSQKILSKNSDVEKFYAIDADHDALDCCKKNLEFSNVDIEFLWENLTKKPSGIMPLDWIVMNPPFHEGKGVNVDVGQKLIEIASQCLKPKGVLYMVANLHLPYEKILQNVFGRVENIIEEQGFKIFKAVK